MFAVFYAGVRNATYVRLKEKGMPTDTKEYLDLGSIKDDGSFERFLIKDKLPREKGSKTPGFFAGIVDKFKKK